MRPDIDGIAARCEAATEGPWKVVDDGSEFSIRVDEGNRPDSFGWMEIPNDYDTGNDWRFIAAARTDIPDLLAYIDELETRNA